MQLLFWVVFVFLCSKKAQKSVTFFKQEVAYQPFAFKLQVKRLFSVDCLKLIRGFLFMITSFFSVSVSLLSALCQYPWCYCYEDFHWACHSMFLRKKRLREQGVCVRGFEFAAAISCSVCSLSNLMKQVNMG